MRLPRVRVTVRRVLALVGALALLLGAGRHGFALYKRSQASLHLAEVYAAREKAKRQAISERRLPFRCFGMTPDLLAHERVLADRFARYKAAYLRVARYPWLPVEPGSPEPR
jgi:hypothetical protein